jgi:hypothetical protein
MEMLMGVSKATAARIVAEWNGWVESDFPSIAEKGQVYHKIFRGASKVKLGVFVVGQDTTEFPLAELLDVKATPNLELVVIQEAVNLRTLSLLWLVETRRKENLASHLDNIEPLQGMSSIEIVGEVGEDDAGRPKYGLSSFDSTLQLGMRILDILRDTYSPEIEPTTPVANVNISSKDFAEVLSRLFEPRLVTFQIDGDTVTKIKEPK